MNTNDSSPASLAAAHGYAVRVRTAGPVTNLGTGEKTAVWQGDIILVISRVGSRRKCRVTYRHGECVSTFTALVPKRWLKTRRYNAPDSLQSMVLARVMPDGRGELRPTSDNQQPETKKT